MYCGSGAGGIGPVNPGAAFAASGTLVGKDANYDGMIAPNEMGFVPDGGNMYNPGGDGGDCADCVKTVTTYKTVQVPCTRNQYRTVNIKIPKVVPYTATRPVTKIRTVTRMEPKTIFVNVKSSVPYTVQQPYTAHKTILINQPKTTCFPVTRMVQKRIPVVNVIPQNPGPCPPDSGPGCGPSIPGGPGIGPVYPGSSFAAQGTLVGKDANYDGMIAPNEMGFIPRGPTAVPYGNMPQYGNSMPQYGNMPMPQPY